MITLIEKTSRRVDYFGVLLDIPRHLPYIATNFNGEVWCYEVEPYYMNGELEWDVDDADQLRLGTVNLNGLDWKKSMIVYGLPENVISTLN